MSEEQKPKQPVVFPIKQKPNSTSRSFSGRSALVIDAKAAQLAKIEKSRCSVCAVPVTADVKILFCRNNACPFTKQRFPTPEQVADYGFRYYPKKEV